MISMMAATAISALALGGWHGERGNGTLKEEERQVEEFKGVDVGGGLHVDITVGRERRVTVTADENLLPLIKTRVRGGILQLERETDIRPTRPIKLTVVTPTLERISASGGVVLNAQAAATKRFTLEASGGARIDLRGLDAEELELDLSGGVEAKIAGKARSARLEVSGGVDLDAQALEMETAKIQASGGVTAKLAVSKAITGDASGGVKVRIKGRPSIDVDTAGASSVRTD